MEINSTYTVVDIFTQRYEPSRNGATYALWLLLWKDPGQRRGQPLFHCLCLHKGWIVWPTLVRIIPVERTERLSGLLRWKWKHIYIAPRPVYRAESRLEIQNLVSRLSPSLALPAPPFFISASVLENSEFKLDYIMPLQSVPWTPGSPPLTLICDLTFHEIRRGQMSLILGWCDSTTCVGNGAEAGSQSSPHFALVRFHDPSEDPDSLASDYQVAGGAHDCDDHIARWANHMRSFTPLPSQCPTFGVSVTLSFRDRMPHVPFTTLELQSLVMRDLQPSPPVSKRLQFPFPSR